MCSSYDLIATLKNRKKMYKNGLFSTQDGNLVFAEECQTNLLPVLQHWFHLEDTTDNALSVLFLLLLHKLSTNQKLKKKSFSLKFEGKTLFDIVSFFIQFVYFDSFKGLWKVSALLYWMHWPWNCSMETLVSRWRTSCRRRRIQPTGILWSTMEKGTIVRRVFRQSLAFRRNPSSTECCESNRWEMWTLSGCTTPTTI